MRVFHIMHLFLKKVVTECMSFYIEGSQCLSEYDEIIFSDKKEIF